jgi:hypothetical protein
MWFRRAPVELLKDMPTWIEFVQCLVIAVMGLAALLLKSRSKRGKSLAKPPVSAARNGLLDGDPR